MAMFVHLAQESQVARIKRNGIRLFRRKVARSLNGVYAMPVTRSFYASHQWLRELKRRNNGLIVGIYFRIPDSQLVCIGHYNQAHRWMSAAEATKEFLKAEDSSGWEIIVPRAIEAREIHRVRRLPQLVGWRFYPTAKGRKPCACKFCTRGDYGAKRLRERLGDPDE